MVKIRRTFNFSNKSQKKGQIPVGAKQRFIQTGVMSLLCIEEQDLYNDSKYKSYVSSVEKVLKNFEYSGEWADLISNLAKLKKVIESHSRYAFLPKRITLAKRLSQCLHPNLPTGVHLKALEVYSVIMENIGQKNLIKDIFLYSPALTHLFPHSSFTVKPCLLDLFESFFLPLSTHLNSVMPSILVSLFSAIEEPSDLCERILLLIDRFAQALGPQKFFSAFWLSFHSSVDIRFPALAFVLSRERKIPTDNQNYLLGSNADCMVSAIGKCLVDNSSLVMRSILDFLIIYFPFHRRIISDNDLVRLLSVSFCVLLHRDVSLNRRLINWILCPSSTELDYFERHSRSTFIKSLKAFANPAEHVSELLLLPNHVPTQHFISIIMTLLDHPKLAVSIIECVLLDVLFAALKDCPDWKCSDISTFESAKALSTLLYSFELPFIWGFLGSLFTHFFDANPSYDLHMLCNLTDFIITVYPTAENNALAEKYLPSLVMDILSSIQNHFNEVSSDKLFACLNLCSLILKKCLPIGLFPTHSSKCKTGAESEIQEIISEIIDVIEKNLPLLDCNYVDTLKRNFKQFFVLFVQFISSVLESENLSAPDYADAFNAVSHFFIDLSMLPGNEQSFHDDSKWYDSLMTLVYCDVSWPIQDIAVRMFIELVSLSRGIYEVHENIVIKFLPAFSKAHLHILCENGDVFKNITRSLWKRLSTDCPSKYAIKTAELICLLDNVCPSSVCEYYVCEQLTQSSSKEEFADVLRRFNIIWSFLRDYQPSAMIKLRKTFERPVLIILGSLEDRFKAEINIVEPVVLQWLVDGDFSRIMDIVLLCLFHPDTAKVSCGLSFPMVAIGKNIQENKDEDISAVSSGVGNNPENTLSNMSSLQALNSFTYTQTPDVCRLNSIVRLLHNLFSVSPKLFSRLIFSTHAFNPLSVHNSRLLDLFLRHCSSFPFNRPPDSFTQCNLLSYLDLTICSLLFLLRTNLQSSNRVDEKDILTLKHSQILALSFMSKVFMALSVENLCLFEVLERWHVSSILLHHFVLTCNDAPNMSELDRWFSCELLNALLALVHIPSFHNLLTHSSFVSTIMFYLDNVESNWYFRVLGALFSVLPAASSSLKPLVSLLINHLCKKLIKLAPLYHEKDAAWWSLSPNYVLHTIQFLNYLIIFTMFDANGDIFLISSGTVGASFPVNQVRSPQLNEISEGASTPFLNEAREVVFEQFPVIVSALITIWTTVSRVESNKEFPNWIYGSANNIKKSISNLIYPLILNHGVRLVASICMVWSGRRKRLKLRNASVAIVNFILSMFRANVFVMCSTELIQKADMFIAGRSSKMRQWVLQIIFEIFHNTPSYYKECFDDLNSFLKEACDCSSTPPEYFLILGILRKIAQNFSKDFKWVKEFQDVAIKIIESCNSVVASSLEQIHWLKKNVVVKLHQANEIHPYSAHDADRSLSNCTDDTIISENFSTTSLNHQIEAEEKSIPLETKAYSLQALITLGEHLTTVLEVAFKAEEKERVVLPLIGNLVNNLLPFLKNRCHANGPSARAASLLLMEISCCAYTRKTWKKEIFDIFLESYFFNFDKETLCHWRNIIDNLMSNDKATFKEMLNRVTTIQTGLFVSSEQESEQRAQLLRRFSFVILSSESDQYQRFMPEIQDYLSDLMRLPQLPSLHYQLFIFFRVLLLRFSPKYLISFFPVIQSELLQIMLQMEQDLSTSMGKKRNQLTRLITVSPLVQFVDGTISSNLLHVYLSACKLLELLFLLPSSEYPQFISYRCGFCSCLSDKLSSDEFQPYALKIKTLIENKFERNMCKKGNFDLPILKFRSISSITDLYEFFCFLSDCRSSEITSTNGFLRDRLEANLIEDFVDDWSQEK